MTAKLLFSADGKKIYGAQIVGRDGVDKRIDTIAAVIRLHGTIEDLEKLELSYAPPYSSAKDPVNMAGFTAGNVLSGLVRFASWDAVEKDSYTMDKMRKQLEEDFSFMSYAPILFISAKTGQRLDKLFETIQYVDVQNGTRIPTGALNEMLARSTARVQPPSDKGKRLKIFYITQSSTRPPTFVAFVNQKALFHFSYQRYIENQIRENFGLTGTPMRLLIREHGDGSAR